LEGGLIQAEAALIAGIEHGQTYLNIHTMINPGGEIGTAGTGAGTDHAPLRWHHDGGAGSGSLETAQAELEA